jgi:predicted ATPase
VPTTHESLASALKANKFEPFIRYIRFPHFRNLRDGTHIALTHPVTALVGSNGTNKTAILRALQGCPDYYNVGQYWFSTSLDPISFSERHRFIYGYIAQSFGEMVEVLKLRVSRTDNPDYFEPSRPVERDGMQRMPDVPEGQALPPERSQTRWKAIAKEVIYLDFRSELSAYDKFFFHMPFTKNISTLLLKKASIRRRAHHLGTSLATGRRKHTLYLRERIVEPARNATPKQLEAISEILGRRYSSVQLITHRYFDVEGTTVILKSADLTYSEAFAGSGEFAVAVLAIRVMEAPPRSLILLDEPEVSLHPGAQRRLMKFLADQALAQKHQVVISTHSPEIVRDLPPEAIKVFHSHPVDGKVDLLSQSSLPSEAFFRLGLPVTDLKTVYVEDPLAAAIVTAATRPLGEAMNSQFSVQILPGGANSIQCRFIPGFALAGAKNCMVFLDGDQRPDTALLDPTLIVDSDVQKTAALILRGEPHLSPNGANGKATEGEKNLQARKVLDWVFKYVDYLPGESPDAFLLELDGGYEGPASSAKIAWATRTRAALGQESWENPSASDILGEQNRFLAKLPANTKELVQIRERIQRFLSS